MLKANCSADIRHLVEQLLQRIRAERELVCGLVQREPSEDANDFVWAEENGQGRPKLQLEPNLLSSLVGNGFTHKDLAAFFNVSERTIRRRCKENGITRQVPEYYRKGV